MIGMRVTRFPDNTINDQNPNAGGAAPAANLGNPPAGPAPQGEGAMDVVVEEGQGSTDPPPQIQFPIVSYTQSAPAPSSAASAADNALMDSELSEEDDQEDPINHPNPEEDAVYDPLPLPGLVSQDDPGYGDDSDYEDPGENGFDDGDHEMTEPVENSPYLYRYPQQSYNLRLQQHQPLVLRFHPSGIVPWIALIPLAWASTVQVEPTGP